MSTIYVILGLGEGGRREIAAYLDRFGLEHDDAAPIFDHLTSPDQVTQLDFSHEVAFLLPPGEEDPRPWLEAVATLTRQEAHELGRIFTLIDCTLLAAHAKCRAWYDACLHFGDVVLLANREGAGNKWVRAFEKELQRLALPSIIAMVKKGGRVDHPAELLFPEPRRVSLFFDEPEVELPPWEVFEVDSNASADDEDDDARPGDARSDTYLQRDEYGAYAVTLPEATALLELPLTS